MSIKTAPEVRKSSLGVIDLKKEMEWLKEHACEYAGEWVVLDGDRLIGHGADPIPIVEQARAEGVKMPFAKYIMEETGPSMGGWL
ncbi:MAG TPA: DUF5678 domain-containing protein [Blastocatellia bacterium]|nr:DUF5678 domain-containing protein [Blastocatellia bacterium]